jgi:hypothetical protein
MIILFCLFLVMLRLFYSVAEICFEHDWPRNTWSGLALSLVLLWFCVLG